MATFKSDFMQVMHDRGFVHQCTSLEALDAKMKKERVITYIGFDCTAPSLHVGSLIQIMLLRWLQKTGHKPIVLMGGGTTKVGDPSGKDEARKLLTKEQIAANTQSLRTVFDQFLKFGSGGTDAIIIDNSEWLDELNYIEFLRDYGRYFSVNRMLTQDSVKLRLEREQNLSFLEFNYMVLQSYDFVELNRRYGCTLQVGGSDQWGNIVMGIDLFRKLEAEKRFQPMSLGGKKGLKVVEVQPMIQSMREDPSEYSSEAFLKYVNQGDGKELFGITTPLITTSGGAKMGKTAEGAVWLNKNMLMPYDYWQFWRNTEDADVSRFLRLFTDLPMKEIEKLEKLKGAEINEAKKVLANEATKLCHGDRAAKQAAETAKKTFEEGGIGKDIPQFSLTKTDLGKGIAIYELLRRVGLADSGGDAKRLIRGGGARLNDRKIEEEGELINLSYFKENGSIKLSAGRKKHILVKLQ
jgi:tyrosyl-tRNA synthetase